jgi:hypothetical protein
MSGRYGRPESLPRRRSAPAAALFGERDNEKAWQAEVVDTAVRLGWHRLYHTFDSRRSTPGFPDLVLCRPPRLVFAELKSENGRVTREQWEWRDDLEACGAEFYLWRPSDRDEVDRVLASRSRP